MKKLLLLLSLVVMTNMILIAQAPQAFKYQAIARDEAGNVLSMWDISLRVSLIQEGVDGDIVYAETHKVQTNIYGLINLVIGKGNVASGNFSSIEWGKDRHYIKMEMDMNAGENYREVGVSQLYAVPYALYAEEAGHLKQPEPTYKTSEVIHTSKPPSSGSGSRGTPNSKISSSGDSWFNALSGNVGIGTTAPQSKLNVVGNDTVRLTLSSANTANSLTTEIMLKSTFGSSIPDLVPRNLGMIKASFDGGGWETAALSFHVAGSDCWTDNDNDPCERMRITSGGYVGIGTTTPAGILDIAGAYHFPDTDGANGQVLETDGSGTLTWSNNSSTTYSVGDFAQGGIVFWVDETGQHGLVCAKEDQSAGVRWYGGSNCLTRAHGDGPFAGEMNTSIIISVQQALGDDEATYAARICNELRITEGGKEYGDWYLPSKEELNLMYQNKTTIDGTAVANGGSAFASYFYWSSNESSNFSAWHHNFGSGLQTGNSKHYTFRVRSVRAF